MPRSPITSERQAKDQAERAVEMLAEVRRYCWDEHQKTPKDSEWFPREASWLKNLSKAIHLLDPGADEMLMPSTDAERARRAEVIRTGNIGAGIKPKA
jgi:hypothetical protein